MHSLTYTQKSCRQNAGSRDAYVYMRTFFATRKPQQANQRAESKKNAYTIYTLNIHFLYSKSAYTIYTHIHPKPHFQPAAVLPTAQSLLSHPANLPAAGRNIPNNYSPTSHFAGIYNAAKPSNHNATTTIHQKEVHTYPAAGIYIFFRPFFPLPSKRQTWSIHPTVEEKREKGV